MILMYLLDLIRENYNGPTLTAFGVLTGVALFGGPFFRFGCFPSPAFPTLFVGVLDFLLPRLDLG